MEKIRIAVVGDIMVDRNRIGISHRFSPEDARCPVLEQVKESCNLGGSGNLAVWLSPNEDVELDLMGIVGCDKEAENVFSECDRYKIDADSVFCTGSTIVKERTYLRSEEGQTLQQLVRCDWDSVNRPASLEIGHFIPRLKNADLIVVADYGKGLFKGKYGEEFREQIGTAFPHSVRVVNSKTPQDWEQYHLDALICNASEAQVAWKGPFLNRVQAKYLVITRSEKGASIFPKNMRQSELPCITVPSQVKELVDPTGAGDAFAAGFATDLYRKLRQSGTREELSNLQLERILYRASTYAACCCKQIGAGNPSLLSEMEE